MTDVKNRTASPAADFSASAATSLGSAALWLLLVTALVGCSDTLTHGLVTSRHPASVPPPTEFEGDAQGGVQTPTYSADLDVPRAAIGGSYYRKQVSSTHFSVTGGILAGN